MYHHAGSTSPHDVEPAVRIADLMLKATENYRIRCLRLHR